MSRKRKKSRLTKTDINSICEMQKKIDAYKNYIMVLEDFSSLEKLHEKTCVVPRLGTDMDDFVQNALEYIKIMKYVCESVQKEELGKIKTLLSKNEDKTSNTDR